MLVLLIFFVQLLKAEENTEGGKCDFAEIPSSSSFVHSLAKPTNGFLKNFGLEGGFYIYCDFLVPWALIFFIFLFWFLFTQCCACCACCTPKYSKKPSIVLVVLFVISAVCLFVATIMFLVSAIQISTCVKEVIKAPDSITGGFDTVIFALETTLNDTFLSMENLTVGIEANLRGLVKYMTANVDIKNAQAIRIQENITNYTCAFNISCSEKDSTGGLINANFKRYYDDFNSAGVSPADKDFLKGATQDALKETAPKLIDIAQKMIDGAGGLEETVKAANKGLNDNLADIRKTIQEQKGSVDVNIAPVKDFEETLTGFINPVAELFESFEPYINLVAYVATAVILFVTVVYVISFFFRCCCTRCLMAWFHCFGLILNILIILPAILFAVVFSFLDQNCYKLEDSLIGLVGGFGGIGVTGDNFKAIFVCDTVQPVYDLGFKDIFDYEDIIDNNLNEIPDLLNDALNLDGIDGLNNFDNFSDGMNLDEMFTGEKIIYDYPKNFATLRSSSTVSSSTAAKDALENIEKLIINKEEHLKYTKENMLDLNQFADSVKPTIDKSKNETTQLGNNFVNDTSTLIRDGFNSITCEPFKCIYSPIKNALCAYVYGAMTFWLISALLMTIGLALMSCVICRRRRGLLSPQIAPMDEEDDDQELAGFSSGTPL